MTKRRINGSRLSRLNADPKMTAAAADLVYVSDREPGISRRKSGKGFSFSLAGRRLTDPELLARIRKLVIPPAWQKVWICKTAQGHLQATGYDLRGRKQYIYHPHWNLFRNMTKFAHLYDFGLALPAIRKALQRDLALPGMPAEKVLALIVSVMEDTSIRIGNAAYEQQNGSYGLTTLLSKHVSEEGTRLRFLFSGKKAVQQDVLLSNRRLVRIVKQCRDMPGKELFQYYDSNDKKCSVDSGMVNAYIRTAGGSRFSAKDFRTWSGSLHALQYFSELEAPQNDTEAARQINTVLDRVAADLGNTRSVCRKYYVHPQLIDLYTAAALPPVAGWEAMPGDAALSPAERTLMYLLKQTTLALDAMPEK